MESIEPEPGVPRQPEPDESSASAGRASGLLSGRRRWIIAGALLMVVAAAVAAGVVRRDTSSGGYTDEVRDAFMRACTAESGEAGQPVCSCFYGEIVENVPYERYEQVNRELLANPPSAGEVLRLPDDLEALLEVCRDEAGASQQH